ncbi:MAG: hypothetical protein RMX96_09545 [Nostoc sp. ChiSLP02]|nr:hypothetical protein [Nostoc sp. DedSLP05]MDZ8101983.1 hypothetical protein [Nostoc sp. DedSLP01]MDZ8185082.1 hypothetical protein [Nostoc sp. ChiSLP02]
MKINQHVRAKVLMQSEIQLIFSHGLNNDRDRVIMLFTQAVRVNEQGDRKW